MKINWRKWSWRTWVVIVCIIIVAISVIILTFYQYPSEKREVEKTIRAYLDALNSYDVDGAWALMSPGIKDYIGYEAFANLVHDFEQRGWQAETKEITNRTFLLWEIKRTWKFTLTAEITETKGTYTETWDFWVVNVGPHGFAVEWKVDACSVTKTKRVEAD